MTPGNYKYINSMHLTLHVQVQYLKKKDSDHIPNSVLNYLFVHVHLNHFRIP